MSSYTQEEMDTYSEGDFEQVPPADIVAFNELRSCSDLVRLYKKGKLDIQPPFQREKVWQPKDFTRFIDSLIKQLPIPSMCFSLDYKTQEWQVIDGLQRMSSIIKFLEDKNWRFSRLDDVDPRISGLSSKEIQDVDSKFYELYERVENLSLPITVLRCDLSKKSHNNYLFTIFHRLNTGGTKLNNQEIRNCIYGGPFNDKLKEWNESEGWKIINNIKEDRQYRFATVELILRLFAFFDNLPNYTGKLARFLNEYMSDNKDPGEDFLAEKEILFNRIVAVLTNGISHNLLHESSLTILEAITYACAKNIDALEQKQPDQISQAFSDLKATEEFSAESLKGGLSAKEKVQTRLKKAQEIFGNI
jgi:hypothetical protein